MGLFTRARSIFLGRRRAALASARRAEALGQLSEATALYLDAEAPDQAARLFALRADAAMSASERYLLLGQALSFARGEQSVEIERRRARLALELVRSGELQQTQDELRQLAAQLARLSEPSLAADVYALVGDAEEQARMLVEAGAIERLESVLDAEQDRARAQRERVELGSNLRDLMASGRRREGLELSVSANDDPSVADLVRRVRDSRVLGARVSLELEGNPLTVVFGNPVTLGRSNASIVIASPAVSREHLAFGRSAEGPRVEDLGSSNGTLLRGVRLDAPLTVTARVELMLGGDVPVAIEPWGDGGVVVECAGERLHLPLGPFVVGQWQLRPGADEWLELAAHGPACLSGLRVHGTIQLCRGDELRVDMDSPVRLRVPA